MRSVIARCVRRRRMLLLAVAAVPLPALGDTHQWVGNSGNWSDLTKWSPAAVPIGGDRVYATTQNAGDWTVTYDYAGSDIDLADLWIGHHGATGSMSFFQAGFRLSSTQEVVSATKPTSHVQTGGTNLTGLLIVANPSGEVGAYDIGGGLLSNSGNIFVGNSGTGTFNHSGGTVTTSYLGLGQASGGAGTYTMSGGALNAGQVVVGTQGIGIFNHSGGTHTVSGLLTIQGGSSNAYTLSGGRLAGNVSNAGTFNFNDGTFDGNFNNSGTFVGSISLSTTKGFTNTGNVNFGINLLIITSASPGASYIQSAGTLVARELHFGWNPSDTGVGSMSGGRLDLGDAYVGGGGNGTFTQSGGTNSIAGYLMVGDNPTGNGVYNLSGGVISASEIYPGRFGNGVFNHSGGSVSITGGGLRIGWGSAGSPAVGTYSLSNTASLATTVETVGEYGSGTFNQTGGTHSVSGTMTLGAFASGTGTVNLSGGTLTTANTVLGPGAATFNHSGGTHTISGLLDIKAGSNKVYTLSGTGRLVGNVSNACTFNLNGGVLDGTVNNSGTFVSTVAFTVSRSFSNSGSVDFGVRDFVVSSASPGAILVQTGGTLVADDLILASSAGYTGAATLSGGALSLDSVRVGSSGGGVLTHSGGTVTAATSFYLAYNAGSSGTYNMTATASLVTNDMYVGRYGIGIVNQSGGSVALDAAGSYSLELGRYAGAAGTYNLVDGALATYGADIGYEGSGVFNQSGGTHSVTGSLFVALRSASSGTMTLSAGLLSVTGNEFIGHGGTGQFTQSGGTHVVTSKLMVGSDIGGSGVFDLTGGTITTPELNVGSYATGLMRHSGGSISATSGAGVFLARYVGSSGTYNLSGNSTLSGAGMGIGYRDDGVFNHSGGTVTVTLNGTNGLSLGFYSGATGTYNLSAGTLASAGTDVGFSGRGVFVQTGGDHTVSGLLRIAANTASSGSYTISGGTLSATQLANNGTLTIDPGGAVTVTSSMTNTGSVVVNSNTLTVNGSGLLNQGGSIALNAAVVAGSGPVVNDGSITGYGTISGSGTFTNNSLLTQAGGNLTLGKSGGAVNNGTFELSSGRQLMISAPVTNRGTLRLNNALVNGAATLVNSTGGIVRGPGGIQSPLLNDIGGTVLLGEGTLNVAPSFTNAGTISIEGSAASVIGGAIDNSGTIQGLGSIGSAVGNRGTIEPLGGTLRFSAPLNLASAGLVRVGSGSKLLASAGAGTCAGTIALLGGTFDNGANPLNNTGQVSGFGTLAASSMTNAGSMTFMGGLSVVNGPLVNNATKTIRVQYNPAIFTGFVTNNGNFIVTATTATFAGGSSGTPAAPVGDGPLPSEPLVQAALTGTGSLSVTSSGTVIANCVRQSVVALDSASTIQMLTKSQGGDTSVVNSLSISGGAVMDLADNALIVDYQGASSYASVRSAIISAYSPTSAAHWNGPGISSRVAASNASLYGVGYGEASDLLGLSGGATAAWQGQTVDSSAVLARFTLLGDADLSGSVNFFDLTRLAAYYGGAGDWSWGDFNYDGQINFFDLTALAANYGGAVPAGALPGAGVNFENDLAAAFAQVPEPSVLGVLGGVLMLRRRRGRG